MSAATRDMVAAIMAGLPESSAALVSIVVNGSDRFCFSGTAEGDAVLLLRSLVDHLDSLASSLASSLEARGRDDVTTLQGGVRLAAEVLKVAMREAGLPTPNQVPGGLH